MINHVTLMGRLTRNPEIRYTQNNKPVASYTLAVDRGFKDQNGNSITDFIPCVAWGKIAGFAQDYLYKGTLIAVEGRLEQRNWTDKTVISALRMRLLFPSIIFVKARLQQLPTNVHRIRQTVPHLRRAMTSRKCLTMEKYRSDWRSRKWIITNW